jgi:hypothetical protein
MVCSLAPKASGLAVGSVAFFFLLSLSVNLVGLLLPSDHWGPLSGR